MRDDLSPEYVVLGLLMAGPQHGYELAQRFATDPVLGRIWTMPMSLLYANLKRLEAQGWIRVEREEPGMHRTRRVFSLTEAGRAHFLDWLWRPVEKLRLVRVEFLAKLYFALGPAIAPDPDRVERLIEEQIAACRAYRDRLPANDGKDGRGVASAPDGVDDSGRLYADASPLLNHLITRFRLRQVEAVLAWLEECRARLTTGPRRMR